MIGFPSAHAAPHSVVTHSLLRLDGVTNIQSSRAFSNADLIPSAKSSPACSAFGAMKTLRPALWRSS